MRKISKEISQILDQQVVSKMKCKLLILFVTAAFTALLFPSLVSAAPRLGAAQSFAVLGHEDVTNAHQGNNPTTQVFGNLGVTPGTSITGFYPDGTVSGGSIHNDDAFAINALADASTAYTTLSGLPGTGNLTGLNLGGRTLTPGVYTSTDSVALLNGALTLDAQNLANALFVFKLSTALTTGTDAVVNVINGNPGTEIYWVIGSTATLGTDTVFAGNILAHTTVILDPRAEILCGRAFALTGEVTLIDNLLSNDNTAQAFGSGRRDFGSYGFSGGYNEATVPEPSTILLIGSGLAGLVVFRKRITRRNRGMLHGQDQRDI
jgi:type VI secretion system secreted protein VgrG